VSHSGTSAAGWMRSVADGVSEVTSERHPGYENSYEYSASSSLHAKSSVQKLSTIRHG
jgi:hypothetical protein